MLNLSPYYANLLENSPFSSVVEMCNALGLNLDEVYEDESDFSQCQDEGVMGGIDGWHWNSLEACWEVDDTDDEE